jgi:hypothetical protein
VPAGLPAQPQYGEYAPPAAPQAPPAPTPQYGTPQYPQPAAQPGYPGYPADPPAQYYAGAPERSKGLGLVAFLAGLVVLILSPIASVIVGSIVGKSTIPGGGFAANFAAGDDPHNPANLAGGLVIIAQLLIGSGLGIWALVQGIIAVRSRRGRTFGIIAIVFAGVAPILSLIVFLVASGISEAAAH